MVGPDCGARCAIRDTGAPRARPLPLERYRIRRARSGSGDCPVRPLVFQTKRWNEAIRMADLKAQSPSLAITVRVLFGRTTSRRLGFQARRTSRSVRIFRLNETESSVGQSPLPKIGLIDKIERIKLDGQTFSRRTGIRNRGKRSGNRRSPRSTRNAGRN